MEKNKGTISWSAFYNYRKQIRAVYPSLYKLKIKKKLLNVIVEELSGHEKILDVGASHKFLGAKITQKFPSTVYKTMDIDRSEDHDYYNLDEISESFDMIILSEVIEHLQFLDGLSMLRQLYRLLNTQGKIVISTPNIHHPNRYWWDADHVTPYRYDVIGASLLSVGFSIDTIFRIYNDQFLKRFLHMYLTAFLHKFLDVDFAKSIIVVAHKK